MCKTKAQLDTAARLRLLGTSAAAPFLAATQQGQAAEMPRSACWRHWHAAYGHVTGQLEQRQSGEAESRGLQLNQGRALQ